MKNSFRSMILLGLTAFLFSTCSNEKAASIDMDQLKKDIQAMEDAFAAGEKAKDANAVAAYYSDDATSYIRNQEPAVGKEAITARIADRLAKDTTGLTSVYKVVDLFAEENMAVEIGSWTDVDPSGAEVNRGHYMSYFQKKDGKWLCVRDMSVSSLPGK